MFLSKRLGHYSIFGEEMTKEKHIMKFDTGADGFKMMIYVLAFCAIIVLILGAVFIFQNFYKGKLYA